MKPYNQFHTDTRKATPQTKDGYTISCKICVIEYQIHRGANIYKAGGNWFHTER